MLLPAPGERGEIHAIENGGADPGHGIVFPVLCFHSNNLIVVCVCWDVTNLTVNSLLRNVNFIFQAEPTYCCLWVFCFAKMMEPHSC